MRGAVEDEGPVEREAPDVGGVVEVRGRRGAGVDGPVEGWPGRGEVASRDLGRVDRRHGPGGGDFRETGGPLDPAIKTVVQFREMGSSS